MNLFARLSLRHKLRIGTLLLLVCTLAGSLLAYVEMREASQVSDDVALHQVPALAAFAD